MSELILYFDRSVGRGVPDAMRCAGLKNVLHQHLSPSEAGVAPFDSKRNLFQKETQDDEWLSAVGRRGWVVIGQDYRFHENLAEFEAIKQHSIRVFYLWGADASKWEKLRCFARAYDRVVATASGTRGPYIHRITRAGKLEQVPIS